MYLQFAGHSFKPLPSGALWWAAENALLVADLHLEKLSSFAKRGSLLPPYDTGLTLRRLEADIAATGATEVIALGDSFHRDEGTTTLLDADRLRLMALLGRSHWTWIAGNHDPSPHQLGGICVERLEHRGLTLVHEPRRGVRGMIVSGDEKLFLEPLQSYSLAGGPTDYVFYRESDVRPLDDAATCGTTAAEKVAEAAEGLTRDAATAAVTSTSYVAQIATDADNEYVSWMGSASAANAVLK